MMRVYLALPLFAAAALLGAAADVTATTSTDGPTRKSGGALRRSKSADELTARGATTASSPRVSFPRASSPRASAGRASAARAPSARASSARASSPRAPSPRERAASWCPVLFAQSELEEVDLQETARQAALQEEMDLIAADELELEEQKTCGCKCCFCCDCCSDISRYVNGLICVENTCCCCTREYWLNVLRDWGGIDLVPEDSRNVYKRDGITYEVAFDNGKRDMAVYEENMKVGGLAIDWTKVKVGDKVTARFMGSGPFLAGTVKKVTHNTWNQVFENATYSQLRLFLRTELSTSDYKVQGWVLNAMAPVDGQQKTALTTGDQDTLAMLDADYRQDAGEKMLEEWNSLSWQEKSSKIAAYASRGLTLGCIYAVPLWQGVRYYLMGSGGALLCCGSGVKTNQELAKQGDKSALQLKKTLLGDPTAANKKDRKGSLVSAIVKAGPLSIKAAQWAATRPDLFDDDLCKAMADLHDEVDPHSRAFTEQQLEKMHGKDWADRIVIKWKGGVKDKETGQDTGVLGSGCMAQTYRATYVDQEGREHDTAVKVLHPNVQREMALDHGLITTLVGRVHAWGGSEIQKLDLPETTALVGEMLMSQADLIQEGKNVTAFYENFKNEKGIRFPQVFSTEEQVLVMEYLAGRPMKKMVDSAKVAQAITDGKKIPEMDHLDEFDTKGKKLPTILPAHRVAASEMIMNAFLKMTFEDRLIHADMHPGNMSFNITESGEVEINIFDCGLAITATKAECRVLADFIFALVHGDPSNAAKVLIQVQKKRSRVTREQLRNKEIVYSEDEKKAIKAAEKFVGDWRKRNAFAEAMNVGELMQAMLKIAGENGIQVPGSGNTHTVALVTVDGTARQLNYRVNFYGMAGKHILGIRDDAVVRKELKVKRDAVLKARNETAAPGERTDNGRCCCTGGFDACCCNSCCCNPDLTFLDQKVRERTLRDKIALAEEYASCSRTAEEDEE